MELKDRIKAKRLEKGFTLEELASKIGIGKSTLFKYESGAIPNIPSDKIEKIAKNLDTTPAYLMGWQTEGDKQLLEELVLLKELVKYATVQKTLLDSLSENIKITLQSAQNVFGIQMHDDSTEIKEKIINNFKKGVSESNVTGFSTIQKTMKEIDVLKKELQTTDKTIEYLEELYKLKFKHDVRDDM